MRFLNVIYYYHYHYYKLTKVDFDCHERAVRSHEEPSLLQLIGFIDSNINPIHILLQEIHAIIEIFNTGTYNCRPNNVNRNFLKIKKKKEVNNGLVQLENNIFNCANWYNVLNTGFGHFSQCYKMLEFNYIEITRFCGISMRFSKSKIWYHVRELRNENRDCIFCQALQIITQHV